MQASKKEDQQSLNEREYRDQQGNIHHHTRSYMERHDDDKQ